MFPDAEGKEAVQRRPLLSRKAIAYCGLVLASLLIIALIVVASFMRGPSAIPEAIMQNAKSPIYLPGSLPDHYELNEGSFTLAEKNNVLIFTAENGAGGKLIFSEQAKLANFDFTNFHKNQMKDAKTLNDVPYPAFWGKYADGNLALSIVTDDVWILMSATTELSVSELQHIAEMKKYPH